MLRFDPTCHVCEGLVRADADGVVDAVGMAPRDAPRLWVWGPVLIPGVSCPPPDPPRRRHQLRPDHPTRHPAPVGPIRRGLPVSAAFRSPTTTRDRTNRPRTRPTAVAAAPGHRERDGTLMHDHDDPADLSTSRRQLHGHERTLVARELARRYHEGHSLHRIAADCGYSYGRVRQPAARNRRRPTPPRRLAHPHPTQLRPLLTPSRTEVSLPGPGAHRASLRSDAAPATHHGLPGRPGPGRRRPHPITATGRICPSSPRPRRATATIGSTGPCSRNIHAA